MSKPLFPAEPSTPKSETASVSSEHDFDFLVGSWAVQHRRLKHRLTHSSEWETFGGTCKTGLLLGGRGDVDDNVLQAPTGTYRAVTLRSFDTSTKSWSIWWLDSRHPHQLDPPVVGEFRNGRGTFFAKDTFEGRSIVVRYIWSAVTANSAKWQQAFSDDGGKTWETNWIMEFHRLGPADP
ncbi:MAG: hypothetical protein ACRD2S_11875 [Terriglobales bacterium]